MSKSMQLKQLHIVLVLAVLLAALAPAVGASSVQAQAAVLFFGFFCRGVQDSLLFLDDFSCRTRAADVEYD